MQLTRNIRGFQVITATAYNYEDKPLVLESSAIGKGDIPGSSFLWIGDNHHLSTDDVMQLVYALQHWLDHGELALPEG